MKIGVDWMYTEKGFLCHRETCFKLEPSKDNLQEEDTEGAGGQQ
jgi:hypothetical protein